MPRPQLSEGTALLILKEILTFKEFKQHLQLLNMSFNQAFRKMAKARDRNMSMYYPEKQKLLTLRNENEKILPVLPRSYPGNENS